MAKNGKRTPIYGTGMLYLLVPSDVLIDKKTVEECIYNVRGMEVMLDSDVTYFFNVEIKRLNEQKNII